MEEVIVLVVLYQKELHESKTLLSIPDNVKVVIWNNSKNKLKTNNSNWTIFNDGQNRPLSFIYNWFVRNYQCDVYVIFDDDSEIGLDYTFECDPHTVSVPRVFSNGIILYGPIKAKKHVLRKETVALMSGVRLSREAVEILSDVYLNPFDERFVFYGVDTTLFKRLFAQGIQVSWQGTISHDLSYSSDNTTFKVVQRSLSSRNQMLYYTSVSTCFNYLAHLLLSVCTKKYSFKVLIFGF